ncbi:hypothetical protein MMC12_005101 [Toensbergia leucococca]|nr:hypothetical protein [Toensbergia leucococca]
MTTTLSTTTVGTSGQVISLTLPLFSESQALSYTTKTTTYTSVLPILFLTELNELLVDSSGIPITTAMLVQVVPTQAPNAGQRSDSAYQQSSWGTWGNNLRGWVIAAAAFAGLALVVALSYFIWMIKSIRKARNEYKIRIGAKERTSRMSTRSGTRRNKRKERYGDRSGRKRGRLRSEGPRGIAGIEDIEMGPAAKKSIYGDTSGAVDMSRENRRRAGAMS